MLTGLEIARNRQKYLRWLEKAEWILSILQMMASFEAPLRRAYYCEGIHLNSKCLLDYDALHRAIDMVMYQIKVAREKHEERFHKRENEKLERGE